jgi:hypothetical protein
MHLSFTVKFPLRKVRRMDQKSKDLVIMDFYELFYKHLLHREFSRILNRHFTIMEIHSRIIDQDLLP